MSELEQTSEAIHHENVPFRFHGQGGEFFRIWIVNILLTIVTLGIYSAWATVRTRRYFYSSTELKGDRFEYLAEPINILKGRLIAIALVILFSVVQSFFPIFALILFLAFIVFVPWIVVRTLRFRAIMSSWRGVRFGFDGDLWGAATSFVLWPLFGVVTLFFGMPVAWGKQNEYMVNNHRFGRTPARTTATIGDFYLIFFMLMLVGLGGMIVISILGALVGFVGAAAAGEEGGIVGLILIYPLILLFYVAVYAAYQALYFKTVYSNVHIGDNRTRTDVTWLGWTSVVLVNSVLLILTLGIYYPWAKVRLNRYIFDHLWVEARDLDSFVAHEGDEASALGDEVGEAFDLGIGI